MPKIFLSFTFFNFCTLFKCKLNHISSCNKDKQHFNRPNGNGNGTKKKAETMPPLPRSIEKVKDDCKKPNVRNKSKWHNINKSVVIRFYVFHVYIKYVCFVCTMYYTICAQNIQIRNIFSMPCMCRFLNLCFLSGKKEKKKGKEKVRYIHLDATKR